MLATLALLLGASAGCATVEAEPAAQPQQPATSAARFGTPSDQARLQACHAEASVRDPDISVHTTALVFARGGKLVFVDLELPESPQLARCLRDAILASEEWPTPPGSGADSFAVGSVPINLGPPVATPPVRPTPIALRARHRRAVLAALQQGVLRESDPVVREVLNPPADWPSPAMRAELDMCHREALKSHPGLVLHREVIYLTRRNKVLLADVSMPESSELRGCVLDRIVKWSSPLTDPDGGATLSSFFIDLGAPEQLPEPPPNLTAELERRRALVSRALELGLIDADDPLLSRFQPPALAPNQRPPAP